MNAESVGRRRSVQLLWEEPRESEPTRSESGLTSGLQARSFKADFALTRVGE